MFNKDNSQTQLNMNMNNNQMNNPGGVAQPNNMTSNNNQNGNNQNNQNINTQNSNATPFTGIDLNNANSL